MPDPATSLVSMVQARIAAIDQTFSSLGDDLGAVARDGDFEAVLSSIQMLDEPLSTTSASSDSADQGMSGSEPVFAAPMVYLPMGGSESGRSGGVAGIPYLSTGSTLSSLYGYSVDGSNQYGGNTGYTAVEAGQSDQGTTAVQLRSMGVPTDMISLFESAAQSYGIPPQLLAAVAKAESGFDPQAVSSAGAEGLMQIMPSTAAGLGIDPFDPTQAVYGAARILAGNIAEFGSIPLAVAAYNAGAGAVQRYGGIPPYPQTQEYVRIVLSYMSQASDLAFSNTVSTSQGGAGYVG